MNLFLFKKKFCMSRANKDIRSILNLTTKKRLLNKLIK